MAEEKLPRNLKEVYECMDREDDHVPKKAESSLTQRWIKSVKTHKPVFTDPHIPEICPILSLARYLLIQPTSETDCMAEPTY